MPYKFAIINVSDGKTEVIKTGTNTDYHYFIAIPQKGDIVDIGKECYLILFCKFKAYSKKNDINLYHDKSTLIVRHIGRFDKIDWSKDISIYKPPLS